MVAACCFGLLSALFVHKRFKFYVTTAWAFGLLAASIIELFI